MSGLVKLRRAGDLVLSNLVWVYHRPDIDADLVSGRVHIDAADVHISQQTRGVHRALAAALAEIGLTPEHILHQRVHLRDMRDYGRWINVVATDFPDWKPATTVFGEGAGLPPGIEVAVEVVASANTVAEPVGSESAAAATDPFPGATTAGDWIFTSAVAPVDPDGRVVNSYVGLKSLGNIPAVAEFAHQGALGRRDERLAAQMLAVYANMSRILEAAVGDRDSLSSKTATSACA